MKIILVDAINTLVNQDATLNKAIYKLLETYPNPKVILTNANDQEVQTYGLDNMPYPVFTLQHNPDKTNPIYYKKMLAQLGLTSQNTIYIEHNPEAVSSAKSLGITTHHHDKNSTDLNTMQEFLDHNL